MGLHIKGCCPLIVSSKKVTNYVKKIRVIGTKKKIDATAPWSPLIESTSTVVDRVEQSSTTFHNAAQRYRHLQYIFISSIRRTTWKVRIIVHSGKEKLLEQQVFQTQQLEKNENDRQRKQRTDRTSGADHEIRPCRRREECHLRPEHSGPRNASEMVPAWRRCHGRAERNIACLFRRWVAALHRTDQHKRWRILFHPIPPFRRSAKRRNRHPAPIPGRRKNLQIASVRWHTIFGWSFKKKPVVAVWHSDEEHGQWCQKRGRERGRRDHDTVLFFETVVGAQTSDEARSRTIRCRFDAANRIHAFAQTQRWEQQSRRDLREWNISLIVPSIFYRTHYRPEIGKKEKNSLICLVFNFLATTFFIVVSRKLGCQPNLRYLLSNFLRKHSISLQKISIYSTTREITMRITFRSDGLTCATRGR